MKKVKFLEQAGLMNKETKNVTIYIDGIEETNLTIDQTKYDDTINAKIHFGTGAISFTNPPPNNTIITADYTFGTIANGTKLMYDQSIDGNSKNIDITFIDPVHIKDGLIIYENGALDSTANLWAICPQYGAYIDDRLPITGVYKDDNGNIVPAIGGEKIIANHVVDQLLLGTAYVGVYFDIEARSIAIPPGYIIRLRINAGSATNLKAYVRMEINRERTAIK